jgi:Mg-chelatase subunit ChlD
VPAISPGGTPLGDGAPGITDESGGLVNPEGERTAPDPEVLRRARQIAARLTVPRARRSSAAHRGSGTLTSVRYRGGSDDIDLDATLDQLVEHPVPDEDDIIVRERLTTRRSVVLAVDTSGSMKGERVRTAAATVGALVGELDRDLLTVLAFWSDAAVLSTPLHPLSVVPLLDSLLSLPARGLTNISFPLTVAKERLARAPARDARVLLLSDCVHNAGTDPRLAAMALPRLDVLCDTSGEHDLDLARDLARLGKGRLAAVHQFRQVAPAVSVLFSH